MRGAELQLERLDLPFDSEGEDSSGTDGVDPAAALKREVAERLAAHRSRRGGQAGKQAHLVPIADAMQAPGPAGLHPAPPTQQRSPARPRTASGKANRIAATVAERYAQTPSYREFLAAEAARALDEANAKAEIAARNAEAMAAAQQQLLADLDLWSEPESPRAFGAPGLDSGTRDLVPQHPVSRGDYGSGVSSVTQAQPLSSHPPQHPMRHPPAELRVRLYQDAGMAPPTVPATTRVNQPAPSEAPISEEELLALDDEIAFRQAPQFPPPATPPVPIPANLLEFPRQLVAPRKARPRIAEGPLREEAETAPDAAQLRIFEVEPSQIATAPATIAAEPHLPVWSSIRLDAYPEAFAPNASDGQSDTTSLAEPARQQELAAALPLATAPLDQRAMAALVDGCILGFTLLAISAAFARYVAALPPAPIAALAAAATLLVLFVLYQMLFFTFACATPGMRYARISLCTFDDDNPTRAAMRRRTWALLLSACPLGLGFLWALLDEDRLGWHDRISRMYQRGY
jgi:uncharacterized RDD family membrane protein YckC